MTEQEIRQKAVELITSWLGAPKGSDTHHGIIDLYNSHKPLPRGALMSYSMDWCAATVSAVGVALGLTDIMPVECSCGELIKLHKALSQWVEDDAYIPKPGDLIMYSWSDDGVGDNTKAPNHVGMVVGVSGTTITVVEGNMGSPSHVGTRKIQVNARYIRGYCCPDYASKADKPPMSNLDTTPPWYAEIWGQATDMGLVDGTRPEDPVTRAECTAIVLRALETRKGEK